MTSTAASASPYAVEACKRYEALLSLYSRNDTLPERDHVDFWKLGNSFDTMLDFLDTIDHGGADALAAVVLKQYNAGLAKFNGYDHLWFDDFGWWTVATQRAAGMSFFDAASKDALAHITHECWSRFTENAPNVWERRAPNSYSDYHPAFDGGVWNEYWIGTPSRFPGPKGADPESGTLEGIQNTVTNAIYLMGAQRIGRTDPLARQAAQKALAFLINWCDEKEHGLWWQFGADAALVRERVGHFASRSPSVTPAPGYQDNWAWAGDQGLVLGDLSDAMLQLPPEQRAPLLARAKQLISGVCEHMTENDIVLNYTRSGHVPDTDNRDYRTGAGVFWRNALHVWKTNSELRTFLARPAFQKVMQATADAAKSRSGTNIDALTTDTAVLVAASVMLTN